MKTLYLVPDSSLADDTLYGFSFHLIKIFCTANYDVYIKLSKVVKTMKLHAK